MKQNEPVSRIMTAELKTIQVGQKLGEARRMLARNPFNHIPVLDGEKLVGMLSSGDVMKLTYDAGNADPRAIDAVLDNQFTVAGTMTSEVKTVTPLDPIRHAAKLLADGDFHALAVVEEDDRLVGLVTTTDLIRYLLDQDRRALGPGDARASALRRIRGDLEVKARGVPEPRRPIVVVSGSTSARPATTGTPDRRPSGRPAPT